MMLYSLLFVLLCGALLPTVALSSQSSSVGRQNVLGRQESNEQLLVSSFASSSSSSSLRKPPIVYTIAGSDSGGGAGIQADLYAIHNMKCHGCSAITCLTAQNSVGVSAVHAPPTSFLQQQLDTLLLDLPPTAIKIGMLGTRELAQEVGEFLKRIKSTTTTTPTTTEGNVQEDSATNRDATVWVVLDPVMISTSGHRLIQEDAQTAMIEHIFPFVDLLTPNLYEAEALLGRKLKTPTDIQQAARDLLKLGVTAVLIKGGHINHQDEEQEETGLDTKQRFAQDYFLSVEGDENQKDMEPRLCDGSRGVWLRSTWYDSENTHGTGCTLSSATAAALALGEHERRTAVEPQARSIGSLSSIKSVDACCLAKAYVTAGIARAVQLGQGPGPVAQTCFPSSHETFVSIVQDPIDTTASESGFLTMKSFRDSQNGGQPTTIDKDSTPVLGRTYPIVDSAEWVERLCQLQGITDIQLRIKGEASSTNNKERIADIAQECQNHCERAGVRLWVNDHWEAAIKAKCFGVHLGQEDLFRCINKGAVSLLREKGLALGVSTHSFGELSVALGVRPSYISLGPIFATKSKKVEFDPQGLATITKWRELVPPHIPLVVIGGIATESDASSACRAGADCVAIIGAVTKAKEPQLAVSALNYAMIP